MTGAYYTPQAQRFFDQITANDRLLVPEFCLLECTNVIWKQVRFQSMQIDKAQALLKHLKKLPLTSSTLLSPD